MTKLSWDRPITPSYEIGVDRGVLYPKGSPGVVWNGLTSVTENPTGTTETAIFMDGARIENRLGSGTYAASISAFSYPDEFLPYDGKVSLMTGQPREHFGFSYRTKLSNGYKLHLVYNAIAEPTDLDYGSISDVTDMTWDISTSPVAVQYFAPSSHLVVDSSQVNPGVLVDLEDILYGSETSNAYLPTVAQVIALFEEHAIFKIIDHGDGSFTAIGPDSAVQLLDATTFQLSWPSVVLLDSETYQASSL